MRAQSVNAHGSVYVGSYWEGWSRVLKYNNKGRPSVHYEIESATFIDKMQSKISLDKYGAFARIVSPIGEYIEAAAVVEAQDQPEAFSEEPLYEVVETVTDKEKLISKYNILFKCKDEAEKNKLAGG